MSWKSIRQYAYIIMLGVGLSFLIQHAAYAQVIVQQHSMQQTYDPGDHLIENKWIYRVSSPERGEVVILQDPFQERRLIKRVTAVAGDVIDMQDGKLIINGQVQREPYVWGKTESKGLSMPYTVPEGEVFVIGDNREISEDSRSFGSVPIHLIEGKIVGKVWPIF